MRSLFVFIFLVLIGCAHTKRASDTVVEVAKGVELRLPSPEKILPEMQQVQTLTFEFQNQKRSIQAVLTSKDQKIILIGLLPFGGEAFRVEYSKAGIVSRSIPQIASALDPKYALADMVLAYADSKTVKQNLSAGAELNESSLVREITMQGRDVIRIRYSDKNRFSATMDFENIDRNYRIRIQPIPQGNL